MDLLDGFKEVRLNKPQRDLYEDAVSVAQRRHIKITQSETFKRLVFSRPGYTAGRDRSWCRRSAPPTVRSPRPRRR
jgi:hypothetical protein